MTPDEQVRQAADALAAQLRDDLDRRLAAMSGDLSTRIETAQRAAVDAAVEETRTRVEREVEERLTERFEAERAAAVAKAALEATAAAEQEVSARLVDILESEREAAAAAAAAEREHAAAMARDAALAAETARASAIADAVEETRSATEQEFATRFRTGIADAEMRVRTAHEQRDRAAGEQLVKAIVAIDAGESLSEILGALASGAATQAARTAIFVVEGIALRSWRVAGFGRVDQEVLRLTVADGGNLAEAWRQSAVVHASGADAPVFAALPQGQTSVAVPLVIAGSVIGVLYADQAAAGAVPLASWPASIEVLGRHAARALVALTAARLAQAAGTRPADAARGQNLQGQRT